MSVTSQPTDLSDLRTDLITRVRDATGVTATNNVADRYLNIALHDMHTNPGNNFPWAVRRGMILTHATYTTGTVSITAAARTTVTGSSTLWTTAVTGMGYNNAQVGGKMHFGGSNEIYDVSAVGSDTSITLAQRYTGDALSGASYTYFEDEYALVSDFHRIYDARNFTDDYKLLLIGPQEFRRRFPRNNRTGRPQVATIIQLAFSSSTAPRYRVVFHPVPDLAYQIPYYYYTTNLAVSTAGAEQAQLSATTDEPIIPLRYRHALVFHALYHWYRDRKDDARSQEAKAEYVEILQRIAGEQSISRENPRLVPQSIFKHGRSRGGRFEIGSGIRDSNGNWGD
jgi:hypothetical protein